jgi:sugar fermentation stimulation protein A
LIPARFLRRYKRFLAEAELANGERHWVHVPNSGALTGCNVPGQEILLTADHRPGRKTSYTWRFCTTATGWVCIDTLAPNRLVAEVLKGSGLPGLPPLVNLRPETTLPQGGRLDFSGQAEGGLVYIEVKSVTWVEAGVALFPDGVTSRGRRHLQLLADMVRQGHEAWQVFVVQRADACRFRPAAQVDPAYAAALAQAKDTGVQILVLQESVAPPEITLASSLPFDLS